MMNNEDLELDKLLRQSLRKEVPLPKDIDRETLLRMRKAQEKKDFRFITLLISLSLLLSGIWFAGLWHLLPDSTSRVILISIYSSVFSLLILFYIINYNLNIRKENFPWT